MSVYYLSVFMCVPQISVCECRCFSPALPGLGLQYTVIHVNRVRQIQASLLMSFTQTHTDFNQSFQCVYVSD